MQQKLFNEFHQYLQKEQKDKSVAFAMNLLDSNTLSIEQLYQDLLTPALTMFECEEKDEEVCIWKEHLRTSIIRTILESCYLHIVKRASLVPKINKKIVVLTPAFEYHEIGAIMVSHFLLLEGFDASYIGANTPKHEILSAIRAYHPDYVALSVTTPYNMVITKQVTDEIKRFFPEVKIILGGQAFAVEESTHSIQYDYLFKSMDDLKSFGKEVSQ